VSDDTKCISTCVTRTFSSPGGHKIYLKTSSHASDDRNYISTCVDQTHHMPAKTQNLAHAMQARKQNVLNSPNKCKRGHKMHLDTFSIKPYHPTEVTISISTRVDQTHHMHDKTQKVSQLVLTKSILWQRGT
jgi:hypothetical protein